MAISFCLDVPRASTMFARFMPAISSTMEAIIMTRAEYPIDDRSLCGREDIVNRGSVATSRS